MDRNKKLSRFSEAEDVILINSVKSGLDINEICKILNGRNDASVYFRIGYLLVNKKLQVEKSDITMNDVTEYLKNNNIKIENNKLVRWTKEEFDINS